MKIKATIGDNFSNKTVGDVAYANAQTVNFFYVFTEDAINKNNASAVVEARNAEIPQKKTYPELVSSHEQDGLILMNYDSGSRIYPSIINYQQYGLMTVPRDDYISAISIYKKEIWYDMVETSDNRRVPKLVEEPRYHLVTNKSENGTIYDFNVSNNRYYKYLFRVVYSAGNEGGSLTEELKEIYIPIRIGWTGWTLTELHEVEIVDKNKYNVEKVYTASLKDVWKFKYNISPGDISQDLSKTAQDTLSKFPKFIHGPKNTAKGQVSCLLGRDVQPFDWENITYSYGREDYTKSPVAKGDWQWTAVYNNLSEPRTVDGLRELNDSHGGPFNPFPGNAGGYKEELWPDVYYADRTSNKQVDLLNQWQKFCYSGNPKLLKDQIGNKYIVQIHDPSSHVEEGWEKRPITISFSWTQIGDTANCQILKEA